MPTLDNNTYALTLKFFLEEKTIYNPKSHATLLNNTYAFSKKIDLVHKSPTLMQLFTIQNKNKNIIGTQGWFIKATTLTFPSMTSTSSIKAKKKKKVQTLELKMSQPWPFFHNYPNATQNTKVIEDDPFIILPQCCVRVRW